MKLRSLDVSYGQVAVFQSALQQPFNDWTNTHVAQGFAWRKGSVSFATLENAGPMEVKVGYSAIDLTASRASRIIAVPFSVDQSGSVEFASIADSEALTLRPGEYRLVFEHGLTETAAMWCKFSFEAVSATVSAEILRADNTMAPSSPLLMEAAPA
jgi:hypothetical protein